MSNTFDAENLVRVPAHLEDIVGTYDLDYSDPEQAALAERIDAAADWAEEQFEDFTRADALDWLWNDGDFISKLVNVEHEMAPKRDLAAPTYTIGVTRLGTRLVTHSDPTLLTPERAEQLLAAAYVDGLLSSWTRAVEAVEFDGQAFWWPLEQEPVRHAWEG